MQSTHNTMEEALRATLQALREEAGWGYEEVASRIRWARRVDGRRATMAHTTVRDLEMYTTPRGGWDQEVLPDYAQVFDTTVDAIWRRAASLYWGDSVTFS